MIDNLDHAPWTYVLNEITRILFVDDDLILAEFAKVHLSSPVATVESAANGAEAWERLSNEHFDIVLVDIEMPVLDGFGLLEKIRSDPTLTQLPVVMLTGREDIASMDHSFRLGATSFFTKPINWRQLAYALRYVLRASKNEQELFIARDRADELASMTNNLLHLIKMEARTPLDLIMALSENIQQAGGEAGFAERCAENAGRIGEAARNLEGVFLDLIQYAQMTSGDTRLTEEELDAAEIARAAVGDMRRRAAREGVALEVRTPSEPIYILCDRHWMTRAFWQLIENALRKEVVGSIAISFERTENGGVAFTIAESDRPPRGEGSMEEEPGGSLPVPRTELGVGTPFARRIAELHGGRLHVRSVKGGTTVEIVLPARRVVEAACARQA